MSSKTQKSVSKYHVPALEKGLDILETLAFASQPQSMMDLARTLNRNKNEIFRMISCLEARGYIVKEERSGNYSLSLKLYELAHTHSAIEKLLKAAATPMEELAQALRQTCILSVLHKGQVITLVQALSPTRVRLSFDLGMPYTPIHSVSGRLLLAHLANDDLTTFLAKVPDYQALSDTGRVEFQAKLAEIRHAGYSTARDEFHVGVEDISVLVGHPEISLIAALTVPIFIQTKQPGDFNEILTALRQCARTITEAAGLTPPAFPST